MDRTATQQAEYAAFDFADFAQEFLRRNQAYRREYTAIEKLAGQDPSAPSCQEMARAWGLVFPDRAGRQRGVRTCRVAGVGGALDRLHESGARRIHRGSPG